MARRLLSIWLPRLASDTSLRSRPVEGPFALTHRSGNSDHLHCVNLAAMARGLTRGMALADARAICPDLATRPADLARLFLEHVDEGLARTWRRAPRVLRVGGRRWPVCDGGPGAMPRWSAPMALTG